MKVRKSYARADQNSSSQPSVVSSLLWLHPNTKSSVPRNTAPPSPEPTMLDSLNKKRKSVAVGRLLPLTETATSPRRLPTLGQHVKSQRVAIGKLIPFHDSHRRQHMPDAIVIEDIALSAFVHGEAIEFVFVIVSDDHFATTSSTAAQQMRDDVLLPVFMQARRAGVARTPRRGRKPDDMHVHQIFPAHRRERQILQVKGNQFAHADTGGDRLRQRRILPFLAAQGRIVFFQLHVGSVL